MKRAAEHIGQSHKLFGIDLLAGYNLRLQRLDLHRQRRSLPDKDFRRLGELVLPAEIIGKGHRHIAIARLRAPAVNAAKRERIICRDRAGRWRSRRNPRAFRCRSEAILDNMRASLPHAIHNAPFLRVFMCAAARWAIRPLAVGRKNYLFAGSDEGGHRAAIIYALIETARLNDVDPEAWLGDAKMATALLDRLTQRYHILENGNPPNSQRDASGWKLTLDARA